MVTIFFLSDNFVSSWKSFQTRKSVLGRKKLRINSMVISVHNIDFEFNDKVRNLGRTSNVKKFYFTLLNYIFFLSLKIKRFLYIFSLRGWKVTNTSHFLTMCHNTVSGTPKRHNGDIIKRAADAQETQSEIPVDQEIAPKIPSLHLFLYIWVGRFFPPLLLLLLAPLQTIITTEIKFIVKLGAPRSN